MSDSPKPPLIIREAQESDYSSINALYYNTYSFYHQHLPESYKETPRDILPKSTFLEMIGDPELALILVAEQEERVVGLLYALEETEEDNEVTFGYHRVSIEEVSVHPSYERQGIGTRLLQGAERWARSKGISDLTVLTYAFNKKALDFYEKNGFQQYSVKLDKKI